MEESAPTGGEHAAEITMPITFTTKTFPQSVPNQVFHIPLKTSLEELSNMLNDILEIQEELKLKFNFLHKNKFIYQSTLLKWFHKNELSLEETIELEYTPAVQIESNNSIPHDDWISSVNYLMTTSDLNPKKKREESKLHFVITTSYDKSIKLWLGNDCLTTLTNAHTASIKGARVISVGEAAERKRARDGNVRCDLVTCGKDSACRFWRYEAGKFTGLGMIRHPQSVDCVHVNRDTTLVATGSWDHQVRVWKYDRITELFQASPGEVADIGSDYLLSTFSHTRAVTSVKWSSLHRNILYTVGMDGLIRYYDLQTQSEVGKWGTASSAGFKVNTVQDPNQNEFLLSGHSDFKILLWDTRHNNHSTAFRGHTGFVYDVCGVPGATLQFCSCSEDTTVKLWDVRSERPVESLNLHPDAPLALHYIPEYSTLISGGKDNVLRINNIVRKGSGA